MNWIEIIKQALVFIEKELHNPNLSPEFVASYVYISNGHFVRAFHVLTGLTVSEYIRNRRMSAAGTILQTSNKSVLDIAFEMGYESPEAFGKAFKRFHGIKPSESKSAKLKEFYPMQVNLTLSQEKPLMCVFEDKSAIILNGATRQVPGDNEIATAHLWTWSENSGYLDICYGFPQFECLVGIYQDDGYTIKAKCGCKSENGGIVIPDHKWAVFQCEGEMPQSINRTWNRIYTSWMTNESFTTSDLPQLEVYTETTDGYGCEIWIGIE